MRLSKALWDENAGLARASLKHRFVRGLGDGSLPLVSFREYVAQDAFFLESFARAYALALAHSPDGEGMREFAGLVAGVLEELRMHEGYAEGWGVELSRVEPTSATMNYTDFLLSTASLKSVGETCAAMAPCMRLYAYLGQALAAEGYEPDNPYAEWIETYADKGFEGLATKLETLVDRYAEDTPAVRVAYRRAMELELDFFEANAGAAAGGG